MVFFRNRKVGAIGISNPFSQVFKACCRGWLLCFVVFWVFVVFFKPYIQVLNLADFL